MISTVEFDQFGSLVTAIHSRDFDSMYCRIFREMLDSEQCTALAFAAGRKPEALVMEGRRGISRDVSRRLTRDYLASGYHDDKNIQMMRKTGNRTFIISCNDIENLSFRKHYYDDPGIQSELALMGSFRNVAYYVSFYRSIDQEPFQEYDREVLQTISGLLIKTLHTRREWLSSRRSEIGTIVDAPANAVESAASRPVDTTREGAFNNLRDAMRRERCCVSHREAEICASIALGYSSYAISANLNISVNTVLTHRKRAYAKLGISSQNELFSFYLSALRQV